MEMLQDYIKPELLILIPVLYLIGTAIKKSRLKDNIIPWLLGAISVVLSALWIFANSPIATGAEIATAIFTAITQGVLIAGASVYINQLVKQTGKDE
jgi:hypothetical protein